MLHLEISSKVKFSRNKGVQAELNANDVRLNNFPWDESITRGSNALPCDP